MKSHSVISGIGGLISGMGIYVLAQAPSPEAAITRMNLVEGLTVQLVASEPMITQPVCIEFDPRGRLWVIQYLQYPNPAGLQRIHVDRWSRTVYDRIPQPPPRGPQGSDRLTILEDPDGDGRADFAHDFINGLNLASGLAFGHGGVFVLNVPYLLFYPDRNHDDVPDGDPEVCLTGFGMEDAHSVANSLTWGPDGWLYGCQGSTVTARIRGIEFQQGVWRYHPLTREFELFCEGGGNAWGLDFNEEGDLIYSTNYGGYRNMHGVQGGYYWKSVGKHGALHNPYAYGNFEHIAHTNFTGGHVTVGGLIYQGTNLPARFRGRYVCGDLLGHGVQWHEMFARGSTFTSAHGGYLLQANDPWFAASDVTISPDGAVYVADWHDQRTAHPDPDAEWDRSNGRVYRIMSHPAALQNLRDLNAATTVELIAQLRNPNLWVARQARRSLADRRDPEAILPLRSAVFETNNDRWAVNYLWALHGSGGFNESFGERTLEHRSAVVRQWSVRLLGDKRQVSPQLAALWVQLAKSETNVGVRAQLAASAKRLPSAQALPVIEALLLRDLDLEDPFVPLLLWWAVEQHSVSALAMVERFLTAEATWRSKLVSDVIAGRLMRRWIAEGSPMTLAAAARLLHSAPSEAVKGRLLVGMSEGFRDPPAETVEFGTGGLFARTSAPEQRTRKRVSGASIPPALRDEIQALWRFDTTNTALIQVGALCGLPEARLRAVSLAGDARVESAMRVEMIQLLGELMIPEAVESLLGLVGAPRADVPAAVQLASLDALAGFEGAELGRRLLARFGDLAPRLRGRLVEILLGRRFWAGLLLEAVDTGKVASTELGVEQLRIVALHSDPTLDELVKKHWGNITQGTPEEALAEMRRLNNDLNAGNGDPVSGQLVFQNACAGCHQLFGEGGRVGPDLTHANRTDREFLLGSLVDPSAVIRKEFLAYEVVVDDGRVLTGVILDKLNGQLILGVTTGEQVSLPQSKVVSLRESSHSLMPTDLLKALKPQAVRDLFAYLQRLTPQSVKP